MLSDPEKRARYDRFGPEGMGGPVGFDPTVFADFSDILGDLFGFGDLFGGRRRGPSVAPGADLRYDLEITFTEAAFGSTKTVEIPRLEQCDECHGSGAAAGSGPVSCTACGGRGQVRFQQGFLTIARTCPQCRGEGKVIRDPCRACRGEGRVERRRQIELRIPAGVDSGARLRLTGEGEHGRNGGRRGDLYVVLEVAQDQRFQRQGPHVIAALELTFAQAVLGTTCEVETLHGPVALEVPPGTQHGHQFRLRGKGIPRLEGGGKGDHIAVATVKIVAFSAACAISSVEAFSSGKREPSAWSS